MHMYIILTNNHLLYKKNNKQLNPLYTGNSFKMGNLANSEYPDEMQHDAAFHQGLHSFLRLKQYFCGAQ